MTDIGSFLLELLAHALAVLITVTDVLTGVGFLVTFVALAVAGVVWLVRGLLVRFRSPAATDRE